MSYPIPTKAKNPQGLHQRYKVEKLDGETDAHAVYIVLRIDSQGTDPEWIEACRKAAWVLTENLPIRLKKVAIDLQRLLDDPDL